MERALVLEESGLSGSDPGLNSERVVEMNGLMPVDSLSPNSLCFLPSQLLPSACCIISTKNNQDTDDQIAVEKSNTCYAQQYESTAYLSVKEITYLLPYIRWAEVSLRMQKIQSRIKKYDPFKPLPFLLSQPTLIRRSPCFYYSPGELSCPYGIMQVTHNKLHQLHMCSRVSWEWNRAVGHVEKWVCLPDRFSQHAFLDLCQISSGIKHFK